MHHIGEFADGGIFTHQYRNFLDDVSGMGAKGMTAEKFTVVQTTPPFGRRRLLH